MDERAEKLASARKKLKEFQRAKQESLARNGLNVASETAATNSVSAATPPPPSNPLPNVPISDLDRQLEQQSVNVTEFRMPAARVPFDPIQTGGQSVPYANLAQPPPPGAQYSNPAMNVAGYFYNPNTANDPFQNLGPSLPPLPVNTFPYGNPDAPQQQHQQQQPALAVAQVPLSLPPHPAANTNHMDHSIEIQRLNHLLQDEKQRNNDLHAKVGQQQTVIESLQANLQQAQSQQRNDIAKDTVEVEKLQAELASHTKTISILVAERGEQQAKISQSQQEATVSIATIEELQGRLNASRHRVNELEKELNTLDTSQKLFDQSRQTLCTEIENAQDEIKRLLKLNQDANDEMTNVQHQLTVKTKELDSLRNELQQKNGDIELFKVRVEQLTSGDVVQSNDAGQLNQDEKLALEKQITELQNTVSVLSGEGERIEQQYQTYVQHLVKETTALTQRVEELVEANERATKREESLLSHIQDLERQIQKQISTQQKLNQQQNAASGTEGALNGATGDDNHALIGKLADVEKRNEEFEKLLRESQSQLAITQHQINEKEAHIAELTSALERLQIQTPDTNNLLATMESDKVAASRAVTQNQQLKLQLDEIQKAYVQLSNDKLELTTRLQSEQHLAREIKANYGGLEQELTNVRDKLHFKDEEMIRLSHANTELNKQILQLSQEVDQLRHYDAASSENTAIALKQQLQMAKQELRRLKAASIQDAADNGKTETSTISIEIKKELSGHDHNHEHHEHHAHSDCGHSDSHSHSHSHAHSHHQQPDSTVVSTNNSTLNAADDTTDGGSVSSTINLATNEAMDKLQARFKRTMNEIADLTEEKQRLEHLVLQLQSETETIGEYIALYQTQRRLLKRREVEKDMQLHRIAADREDMRDKLKQLNGLVELLLVQNGVTNARQIMDKLNSIGDANALAGKVVNGERIDTASIAGESAQLNESTEIGGATVETSTTVTTLDQGASLKQGGGGGGVKQETAKKIINLLADIRDKNLKQDFTSVPNDIHHCPCCSGKLEVV